MKNSLNSLLSTALKATLQIVAIHQDTKQRRFVGLATFISYKTKSYIVSIQSKPLNAKEQYAVVSDKKTNEVILLKTAKTIDLSKTVSLNGLNASRLLFYESPKESELKQAFRSYETLLVPRGLKEPLVITEGLNATSEKGIAWCIANDAMNMDANFAQESPLPELNAFDKTATVWKAAFKKGRIQEWDFLLSQGTPIITETGQLDGILIGGNDSENMVYVLDTAWIKQELSTWKGKTIHTNSIDVDSGSPEKGNIPFKNTFDLNDKNHISYPVLYGTNRKADRDEDGTLFFNHERDNKLNLGQCHISIPKTHKLADIEKKSWWNPFGGDNPDKYFTLLDNTQIDQAPFLKLVSERIGESDEKDVLLFIHGFNVEYMEAMFRTAQLGYDLNFGGAVTAFTWPSNGTGSGYIIDTDSARLSGTYLKHYIRLILEQNKPQKLHILAHSMGNVVLAEALSQLTNEGSFPNPAIQQIVLAAPDLDKDIFLTQILPVIKDKSRFTLYASDGDYALKLSRTIRKGLSNRLGEGGDRLVITEGVDSIDASDTDGDMIGHSYFGESPAVVKDILNVFKGVLPSKRSLKSRKKDGQTYWLIPEG